MEDTKNRIMISVDPEALRWIDMVGERFHMTRSQVIAKCVLDTRETLRMLDKLGMKPERMGKIADFIRGQWLPPIYDEPTGKAKA